MGQNFRFYAAHAPQSFGCLVKIAHHHHFVPDYGQRID